MVQIEIDFLLVGHGRNPIRKNCLCKGQLISKGHFSVSILPKKERKNSTNSTIVPQIDLFLFVFWENWRHQKVLSKLTDLYHRTDANTYAYVYISYINTRLLCLGNCVYYFLWYVFPQEYWISISMFIIVCLFLSILSLFTVS